MTPRVASIVSRTVATLIAALSSATGVAQMLPRMNQPDIPLEADERKQVLDALAQTLKDTYAFADLGEKLARSLQDKKTRKAYEQITSAKTFASRVTGQLHDISHDPHLRLMFSATPLPKMDPQAGAPPEVRDDMQRMQRMTNFGFDRVERLAGNIGYLKLNEFSDATRGGDRVTAALAFLADTDALIIDLRDNHGGGPEMVQLLASYFFPGDVAVDLNDMAWRVPRTHTERVTQSWTLSYLPGRRYLDKEVYILTSHRTFSAAEEFAYDLQALKRAVVMGETTGGGANQGETTRLSDHFMAFIPNGRARNPVTGTNWEGVGIVPDVSVPAQDALRSAQRASLQHLIGKARNEREASELKRALAGLETGPAAAPNP
jgi:peptidase S41-like protein